MKTWVVTVALTSLAIPSAFVKADTETPLLQRGSIGAVSAVPEGLSAWNSRAFQRRISADGVISLAPRGNGPTQMNLGDYERRLSDAFENVHRHLAAEENLRATIKDPTNLREAVQALRQSALRELSTMRLPAAPLAGTVQGLATQNENVNSVYRLEYFLARTRALYYSDLRSPDSTRNFRTALVRAGQLASWSARSPRAVVGAAAVGVAVAAGVVAAPSGAQASSLPGGQNGSPASGAQARPVYRDDDFGGPPGVTQ